jgi:murein peptide amidase A
LKGREMHRKWTFASTVGALLAVVGLAGCYEPVDFPEIVSPSEYGAAIVPTYYDIIGKSVQGYPLLCQVLGQGPDVTLIMAAIHGDESAGTPLVRRLARYLQAHPDLLDRRTVVLLPVTNPDGMAHKSRYNAHGVDLNRNFDAPNRVTNEHSGRTALSEPESRAIRQLILEYKPDRIVSIHQPLSCIDYDGPAGPLALRMAQYCDLPVKKIGARPGSLGSYAGVTLGIPIVTFEMPSTASKLDPQALWNGYGESLVAAVVYPDRVEPQRPNARMKSLASR